ncbi:MAG: PEP-CTERM sorting domain-containing protein, partial [Pseudomonadota bacterium]
KVIDAPAADAVDDHNQSSHIWYSFPDPSDGLELIFDFGVSYDIATLHFWNYFGESFDVI